MQALVPSFTPTTHPQPKPHPDDLGFGQHFSDHMLLADYWPVQGWRSPRIVPYGPLPVGPTAKGLHYGQMVFEGLKVFSGQDGRLRLFRPIMHFDRLAASAQALCMPAPDTDQLHAWVTALIRTDAAWVPTAPGTALYVRPFILGADSSLGVRPSQRYLLCVVLSPVGPYFAGSAETLRIRVEDYWVRTTANSTGSAKAAGNYAAGLRAAQQAAEAGFDQVLWLDGVHRRYLDELGPMNVMLVIDGEVLTPALHDGILAGVTRDSLLTLLRDWGMPVTEHAISIDEVVAASRAGTLQELWGCGTGAGVSPVGRLQYRGQELTVGNGTPGPIGRRLHAALQAIQDGSGPDPHGWTVVV